MLSRFLLNLPDWAFTAVVVGFFVVISGAPFLVVALAADDTGQLAEPMKLAKAVRCAS